MGVAKDMAQPQNLQIHSLRKILKNFHIDENTDVPSISTELTKIIKLSEEMQEDVKIALTKRKNDIRKWINTKFTPEGIHLIKTNPHTKMPKLDKLIKTDGNLVDEIKEASKKLKLSQLKEADKTQQEGM